MKNVVKAAEEKFGEVFSCVMTEVQPHGSNYKLVIKRYESPLEDCPYMAITGFENTDKGTVDFFWGHYDLTSKGAARLVKEHSEEMTAYA